ncbi:MAG: FadR/GntR family transcriptional regulator [Pseudomonadales bacterium]
MSKHEEITETLTRDILIGQYRVGERLPSERDLAARFEGNRGAVREAMKKLEQLGIADIQPGGALVAPLDEASLDVIGYLLALDQAPDRNLVDQILVVISTLVETAALLAVERVNDAELEALRQLIRPLWVEQLDEEAYMNARMGMISGFMNSSGNLPVRLIAHTLIMQFVPQMEPLQGYWNLDIDTHKELARKLDEAVSSRDLERVRSVFKDFSELNRQQVIRAFNAFEAAHQPANLEVVAS